MADGKQKNFSVELSEPTATIQWFRKNIILKKVIILFFQFLYFDLKRLCLKLFCWTKWTNFYDSVI